jgi:hypothetical protein
MGLIAAIIGWLQYHLGLRTDAASASGSLHAKIGEVRTYLYNAINARQKPRGNLVVGSFGDIRSTGLVTVLNIAGRGELLSVWAYMATHSSGSIKITIDGTVLATGSNPYYDDSFYLYPVNLFGKYVTDAADSAVNIPFKSSLKIECALLQGSWNWFNVHWAYVLE